jgi:hypothetical protein
MRDGILLRSGGVPGLRGLLREVHPRVMHPVPVRVHSQRHHVRQLQSDHAVLPRLPQSGTMHNLRRHLRLQLKFQSVQVVR